MLLKITKPIDDILNKITIYRLMLYYLIFLWLVAFIFSLFKVFPFTFLQLSISTLIILTSCYIVNKVIALIFKIPTNLESVYISAIILSLIVAPFKTTPELFFLISVSSIAMASKYILALNKKHIFNPVAISVLITSIFSIGYANWWIGNQWMLIPVLIGGLLMIRKIQRYGMVFSFLAIFLLATLSFSFFNNSDLSKTIYRIFLDSPILFFAFVMLIEPLTSPTTKNSRIIYGLLVGALSGSQFSIGPIYSTYETALVAGNIFSYLVSFRARIVFSLKEKIQISPTIYEFVFSPNRNFNFIPGQYLEWTLPHSQPDQRGVRRYFTIASSPTEKQIRLGIKYNQQDPSSFKKTLVSINPGNNVYAGQLAGDFTLPKNQNQKIVFISGGIGITPFRSMIKFLIDKDQKRDIVLFYSCSDSSDFVYKDIFDEGEKIGLKTIYLVTNEKPNSNWKGKTGRINAEMIKNEVPDYKNRIYYLSGPNSMVNSYKKILGDLRIKRFNIKTDYFPGY